MDEKPMNNNGSVRIKRKRKRIFHGEKVLTVSKGQMKFENEKR